MSPISHDHIGLDAMADQTGPLAYTQGKLEEWLAMRSEATNGGPDGTRTRDLSRDRGAL